MTDFLDDWNQPSNYQQFLDDILWGIQARPEHIKLARSAEKLLEACKVAKQAIYSGQNYHDGSKLPNDAIPILEQAINEAE